MNCTKEQQAHIVSEREQDNVLRDHMSFFYRFSVVCDMNAALRRGTGILTCLRTRAGAKDALTGERQSLSLQANYCKLDLL